MSKVAVEAFKKGWTARDKQWLEEFEDVTGLGQFAPTSPSERTEAGLTGVSWELLLAGYESSARYRDSFADGVDFAVAFLNGVEGNGRD